MMRVSSDRRRRWNNILILAVIIFIGVLNLPTLIQQYLLPPKTPKIYVLNPLWTPTEFNFSGISLQLNKGNWLAQPEITLKISDYVERWQRLVGTEVESAIYQQLRPQLTAPSTVEVWYQEQEEPQRITYYQLNEFWLFKNWQNKWVAISVDADYLFPTSH